MQTNNNYGAWVGLGIIILVGAIVLGAFGAGAFDPERQAAANRTNAETALFQEQALQEIAANKAEIQARIENAPALAQLDLIQKQQEIRQQQKDFELTSAIKKAGTVALLALAAAGLIGAIGYTTTRVMARREAPQVAASQEISNLQTTLRQLEEAVRASNATLARNNGQSWHADDSREPGKAAGGHNGTGYHNKDVIDPNNQLWRKAA